MKKEKLLSIDAMRTLSILAVILIHTSTRILEFKHYDLLTYWPSLILNQISRFAVPLFFLISGFVLELNYREDLGIKHFIKKRISKILIPYIFWSLFYYLFVYNQNTENIFLVLLKGSASYQLYFIPTICIFYIIFPLLHRYYKIIANPFIFLVLAYLQITLMNSDYLIRQFSYPDPVRILLLGYMFFITGIVAARNTILLSKLPILLSVILIPITLYLGRFIYLEGMTRYYKTYNIGAFYSQWRPDILIYTIVLAIIFFQILKYQNIVQRLLTRLARLSYLVFFIHVIVIEIIWRYSAKTLFNLLPKRPVEIFTFEIFFFFAVSALSFMSAYVIHRIPKLKTITG